MRSPKRAGTPAIGLDLSLTAPAACLIPPRWRLGYWWSLDVVAWDPPGDMLDEQARIRRVEWIVDRVDEFVAKAALRVVVGHAAPPAIFIEGYAFSRSSSSVTKLAELGGAVRVDLRRRGFVARSVTASAARKLLLGRLPKREAKNATHGALRAAGVPPAWSGDVLDAFVVANFGLTELGLPALTLA